MDKLKVGEVFVRVDKWIDANVSTKFASGEEIHLKLHPDSIVLTVESLKNIINGAYLEGSAMEHNSEYNYPIDVMTVEEYINSIIEK